MLRPALASLLLIACAGPAAAFCLEPNEPYCVDGFGTFDSEWSFNSCRSDIEAYLRDMRIYVDCVVRDAQDKTDGIVEYFNCKASGQSFCFKPY